MCTIRDLYAFVGARRLARRAAVHHQLRGLPGLVQGLELGHGRRQYLHVAARGPMITLTVALEATYTLWAADGSERTVDAVDFVTGNHENILGPAKCCADPHPGRARCANATPTAASL